MNTHRPLLLTVLLASTPLWAQTAATPTAPTPGETPSRLAVGDATRSLLQRQREGSVASTVPRPIEGSVAELSHQRYLKSFQTEVPPWFGSRLGDAATGSAKE
ncbi:DUF3613 domain-containing protein [Hydrogenophaga taeniospiralis]|uniref:DUF3613 domain-containing protein n=1 Tax=Hydrogenophaga taeniospiralis TaxID=65656 RepID=UPI001CF943F0|nr:DUF3613 domain-containing protein [Hydrogenophaga taeniospiralis]